MYQDSTMFTILEAAMLRFRNCIVSVCPHCYDSESVSKFLCKKLQKVAGRPGSRTQDLQLGCESDLLLRYESDVNIPSLLTLLYIYK